MKKSILFSVLVVGATLLQAQSITVHQTCGQNGQVVKAIPDAIDLGLSVKWANMNVGATTPEDYGNYYAWGETTTKSTYNWSTYFDTSDGGSTFTKYNNEGGKTVLDPEDDAAHVNWGGSWHMPTKAEWQELIDNCTWTWTTQNGINGYKVTSNKAGYTDKFIFLPAAGGCDDSGLSNVGSYGVYRSSSLYEYYSGNAWYLLFRSAYRSLYYFDRYDGQSVRPVLQPSSISYSSSANDTIRIYSNGCDDYQTFIGPHGGQLTMTANSDQWSHFVRWNDGNTDNPRTITTNGNADYTAYFETLYKYSVQVKSSDAARGSGYISKVVKGDTIEYNDSVGSFDAGSEVFLAYQANYGYHFDKWSDGNISQLRSFILTQDTAFTATFAKNVYYITKNAEHGSISGSSSAEYLDEVTLSVSSDYGYHFAQWSDGNTDNPRTFVVTQDTTVEAIFDYQLTGKCGKDNALTWTLDSTTLALTISGKGALTENYTYGNYIESLTIGDEISPIGQGAFQSFSQLKEVTLGTSLKVLEENAFANCRSIETITCYSQRPPTVNQNALYSLDYSTVVYVPAAYLNNYLMHDAWGLYDVRPMGVALYLSANNAQYGVVEGAGTYASGSNVAFSATPDYGYHFAQWSDGNMDNPRTIVLTQDTTFVAEFAPNKYSVNVSCDPSLGSIVGKNGEYDYLSRISYEAVAHYGYQFAKWSDGNTQNPRTVTVQRDTTLVAEFAKRSFTLTTQSANPEQGIALGGKSALYLEEVEISATPNDGYTFVQWSDGDAKNPRIVVLTQDTTFVAEFAVAKSGLCGANNSLMWSYTDDRTLTISGSGALTENYTFGVEAPTQMKTLIIGNEVTAIGERAFYGKSNINHLVLGAQLATIGDYAFAECRNFDDITCYATTVPAINETTFANVGNKQYIYLYVPAERERAYKRDIYWGEFDVQIQEAEKTTVTEDEVTVAPADNSAVLTWPTNENAASYTIEITKDGEVFCRLVFNANGQLTGIAFAPSPNGTPRHAPTALMTANGLQFTVTGLNSGTNYGYSVTTKDANDQPIASYSGEFSTTGEVPTSVDQVQSDNVQCTKVLRDGQIFILRGDKVYNAQGALVK